MKRLISLLVLLVTACVASPDSNSGNDYTQSMAKPIDIGATVDDKVDAKKGDNTDWKRFNIEDPGPLKINIYWDNPDKIDATLGLYTAIGVKIGSIKHKSDDKAPKDSLSKKFIGPGSYFLRIHADKGASVYTVEVLAGNAINGSTYGVPRPE